MWNMKKIFHERHAIVFPISLALGEDFGGPQNMQKGPEHSGRMNHYIRLNIFDLLRPWHKSLRMNSLPATGNEVHSTCSTHLAAPRLTEGACCLQFGPIVIMGWSVFHLLNPNLQHNSLQKEPLHLSIFYIAYGVSPANGILHSAHTT